MPKLLLHMHESSCWVASVAPELLWLSSGERAPVDLLTSSASLALSDALTALFLLFPFALHLLAPSYRAGKIVSARRSKRRNLCSRQTAGGGSGGRPDCGSVLVPDAARMEG